MKSQYSDSYYPVLDFSRGGAKFVCNERFKAGKTIIIKLNIPGIDQPPELIAHVRWISKNREQSYKYQTGISFNSYGDRKNENPPEILALLKKMEDQELGGTGK